MSSLTWFPLARRIRRVQINFLPAVLIFSGPTKKPASSGSSSGAFARLNLDYDGCFFHRNCTLHRTRKTSMVAAFIRSRIRRKKGTVLHGESGTSAAADGRVRIAPRGTFPDGDAGAVRLHHRAHNDAGGYHSTRLRFGRQRYLARLCAGNGGDPSRGRVHQPVRTLLGFARLALYLRFDDSSPVAGSHSCLEPAARLYRHGFERYWRLLP